METTGLATKRYSFIKSYKGYKLEMPIRDLEEKDITLLDASIYLVENGVNLLETSENCPITKSTLHRHIHKRLPEICPGLYILVKLQFEENMANRNKVRWRNQNGRHKEK